jgi:ABC-2 type transport system permease protein
MKEIILKTIKEKRNLLLILSAISILVLWLYTAITPSLESQQDTINELMAAFPKEFLAAFNVDSFNMTTFAGVISSKQYDIVWVIMAAALAISLASGNIAGEIEKGTMQNLLALPLSRKQLYFSKYIGGLIVMATFTVLSILPGIPLAQMYGIELSNTNFYYFTLNALGFAVFVYTFGFMFSAFVSEPSRATMPVLGLVLISYILNLIALLKEEFSNLRYFSIFHYYSPTDTLVNGNLELNSLLLFLGFSSFFLIIGFIFFRKRDFRF